MARLDAPRYFRAKKTKVGIRYYWEPPHWARKGMVRHGVACPVVATALGGNLSHALEKAAHLNQTLDEWRKGDAKTSLMPGSVAWLFQWYQSTSRFKEKAPKTQLDYKKQMKAIADLEMREGVFGTRMAKHVDGEVADKLYEKFQQRGRRQATYAMQVCRLVWNWAARYPRKTGIDENNNPFKKMGLNHKVAKGNRHATRAEYETYKTKAYEMGYDAFAVAAALAFELTQRVNDVFGFYEYDEEPGEPRAGFWWEDYHFRKEISLIQHKTRKRVVHPLVAERDGKLVHLYDALERQLVSWKSKLQECQGFIIIDPETRERYKEREVSKIHRKICDAAKLPKDLTFTSFRHGGCTEVGDAGIQDMRAVTGHTQVATTKIYDKAS